MLWGGPVPSPRACAAPRPASSHPRGLRRPPKYLVGCEGAPGGVGAVNPPIPGGFQASGGLLSQSAAGTGSGGRFRGLQALRSPRAGFGVRRPLGGGRGAGTSACPRAAASLPSPGGGAPSPAPMGAAGADPAGRAGGAGFGRHFVAGGVVVTPLVSVSPHPAGTGDTAGDTQRGGPWRHPAALWDPGAPGVKPPVPSRKGVALGGETGAGVQLEDPQAGLNPVNRLGGAGRAGTPPGSSRGWGRDSPDPRAGAPTCFSGTPGAGGCSRSFWGARGHRGGAGRVHSHAWVPLGLRGVLCPPQTFLPAMGPEPLFLTPQDPPSPFPAPMHHQNKPLHPKATLSWPPRRPALRGPLWT